MDLGILGKSASRISKLAAMGVLHSLCSAGPVDVYWVQAADGSWTQGSNWSSQTFYPQNGVPDAADTYRALIDATGAPYRVDMEGGTFVLTAFVIDSPEAEFRHIEGQFHVDSVDLIRGTYFFDGSGTTAAIEDAIVNIGPEANFDFAGYPGSPRQPTGAFRRCTIHGDLVLDVERCGVVFEESIHMNGDIHLSARSSAAIFNGPDIRLDGATIFASPLTTIEVTAGRDTPFVLGPDALVTGTPRFVPRGGGQHGMRNEGTITVTGRSYSDSLAVDNRGLLEVNAGSEFILWQTNAELENGGIIQLHEPSRFTAVTGAAVTNSGLIELGLRTEFSSSRNFEQSPAGTLQLTLNNAGETGMLSVVTTSLTSTFGGSLSIRVEESIGFSPGQEFQIIDCQNYVGQFDELDLAELEDGLRMSVDYRSDGVYVVVVTSCPPDLTEDGQLDFFDVAAFLNAFSDMQTPADWNHDGMFDFFDVQSFLQAFAAGCS